MPAQSWSIECVICQYKSCPCTRTLQQFSTHNRHSLSAQNHPISSVAYLHHPSTHRSLVSHKLILTKSSTPERAQTAMGRPGHRVLVHTCIGREEARHK